MMMIRIVWHQIIPSARTVVAATAARKIALFIVQVVRSKNRC
jgi:hypothetical protein